MVKLERKKIVVIGLGRFGFKLVEELSKMGLEVIAIDKDSSKVEKVRELASESLILDATDKEALEKSGVKEVDSVIVGIGRETEASILVTTLLKEMGIKEIISRANARLHAKILKRVGADYVVFPEEDRAVRLAHTIHFPGIQEYVDMRGPWDLAEFKVPPQSKIIGKKIGQIYKEFQDTIDILTIEKEKGKVFNHELEKEREERESMVARDNYVIEANDILILFAKPENLEKFIKKFS